MTKYDLVQLVQKNSSITKKQAIDLVETILELIKKTLERGEKVKISGFGNFTVQERKERIARNLRTRELIVIPARRVLTFKPSPILKNKINMIREETPETP